MIPSKTFDLERLKSLISEAILEDNKKKYYVGKIILDTKNVNPQTYLGFGIWEYWGSGKVPVGVNADDIDFNEVEKIGGEKLSSQIGCPKKQYGLQNGSGDYSDRIMIKTTAVSGTDERNAQISLLQPYNLLYVEKNGVEEK